MTWHVWTDGSCHHGLHNVPRRKPGWGGWCAIVEHDSDGVVLRGRVPNTTNVRMEMLAVIEGLKATPEGAYVKVHTDCMTILCVRDNPANSGRDAKLWRKLSAEMGLRRVTIQLIVKGERDPIHNRCHAYAGAEARGGLRNLPDNVVPLDDGHRIREGWKRVATARAMNGT